MRSQRCNADVFFVQPLHETSKFRIQQFDLSFKIFGSWQFLEPPPGHVVVHTFDTSIPYGDSKCDRRRHSGLDFIRTSHQLVVLANVISEKESGFLAAHNLELLRHESSEAVISAPGSYFLQKLWGASAMSDSVASNELKSVEGTVCTRNTRFLAERGFPVVLPIVGRLLVLERGRCLGCIAGHGG